MKIRVGFGFDVLRLVEGRELWLGGVRLEHEAGLLGHSDADVLIHAICDALLVLEGIHQRYVYHRAELGNLYLCRICDELLPDQGFALYHSGFGILRQEKK